MEPTSYIRIGSAVARPTREGAPQIRLLVHLALAVTILPLWTCVTIAEQPPRTVSFQVSRSDFAAAQALTNKIAALSPTVRPREASELAQCVYSTASRLRQEYGVVGRPSFVNSLFNNFLVNSGLRKRGLCFQWAEDMLNSLDALKLTSIEFHWGEARAGTMRENNCIVVTAKGAPFSSGIVLDCWRHSGRVYWSPVTADHFFPWIENNTYARYVRARSAAAANHRVAFQRNVMPKRKTDDR